MNQRVLLCVALLSTPACGGASYKSASPGPRYYGGAPTGAGGGGGGGGAAPASAKASEAAYYSDDEGGDTGAAPMTPTASVTTKPTDTASANAMAPKPQEMLDIEARLTIEVEKVTESSSKLRELVKQFGGTITNDTVSDSSGSTTASFAMRIPADKAEAFMTSSEGLGHVRDRHVTVRDVGKEYYDAQLLLQNLEKAMARYEEILGHAKDVKEILVVEQELTRLRGQIEQTKGNLRWMKDRVSRATIYINLIATRPDVEPTFNPTAKLYPGLRFTQMTDFRGDEGRTGYLGAGFSFMFARAFSIDIDALRKSGDGAITNGLDLLLITAGGEFYSDFLGGGRRHFLNPYMGFRAGYAHRLGMSEAVVSGTLGLELYKSKYVSFDGQVRFHALFGNNDKAHMGVEPALALNLAF